MRYPSGLSATSPVDKANLFARTFAANSTLVPSNQIPPQPTPVDVRMPSVNICERKVVKALRSLNTSKSTGPDDVPAIVLKKCALELAPVLSRLYHVSLIAGRCPSSWKVAHIIPVPKKGDKSDPLNYRPIAITSIIGKVFERLLSEALISHLDSNNLLSDQQYGFRRARSTGDLLAYVTHLWSSSLDKFGESTAVALDISKAFDRVWHSALFNKLHALGVDDDVIQ